MTEDVWSARGRRVVDRCDTLGMGPYSDMEGGLFRPYLGPAHHATIERLTEWMTQAGLSVRLDGAGTLIGRYEGSVPNAPALVIGSHIDSVRDGGRYDGMLGVVLGIEAVAVLHAESLRLPYAIEVVGFGDEEGSRFPVSMLTSRAFAGTLGGQDLTLCDAAGVRLDDALAAFGLSSRSLPDAARSPADLRAYLEVHIEQGPVLEAERRSLGVVDAIAGQYRFQATVRGTAGHAGTMAMSLRRDALAAAAEMVLAIETCGRAGPDDLVATVGRMEVRPGASNVVPGEVVFTLDIRAGNDVVRGRAADAVCAALHQIARRRDVSLDLVRQQDLPATPCDPSLTAAMAAAVARTTGAAARHLVSGAGHDAMVLAAITPVSMLFVRCAGGISHHPDEAVEAGDVTLALRTLVHVVQSLDTPDCATRTRSDHDD
ncbi:allantoate amidohydrolase [Ameyamaea chiangmaiensis]|nr:allantoate amidohydrolase [Ameyamaea chiangmaiensis]